jgi:beta-lactam-binding protein with PASTA domain
MYFWGGMLVLFGIGFGVYLLVDAVIMPSYTRHNVSTTVPNVEDVPFTRAKQRLQEQDLMVQRQIGRYNPNVDTGIVVDQTPLPTAKVKPGRRVYLTVNAGEVPIVQIPDLRGMSVREAKNRISSADLAVGSVQKDEIPSPYANTITKQKPEPGDSLEEGSVIDLWYSTGLGDAQVPVPNVVGLSVAEAQRFLLQHELRSVLVDTTTAAEEAPAPSLDPAARDSLEKTLYVRRQASAPGDSVRAGTEVRLYTTPDAEKAARLRQEAKETASSSDESTE